MNIKDCVGVDKKVRFIKYENNELWYECENGLQFPIPQYDTSGATFLAEDKSSLFMRWIRKQLKFIEESKNGQV